MMTPMLKLQTKTIKDSSFARAEERVSANGRENHKPIGESYNLNERVTHQRWESYTTCWMSHTPEMGELHNVVEWATHQTWESHTSWQRVTYGTGESHTSEMGAIQHDRVTHQRWENFTKVLLSFSQGFALIAEENFNPDSRSWWICKTYNHNYYQNQFKIN